jgi:hypothetical protein
VEAGGGRNGGGGGGAGGYRTGTCVTMPNASLAVTVGAGGAGATSQVGGMVKFSNSMCNDICRWWWWCSGTVP